MGKKKLIFIVDDEDLVRWSLEETFKGSEYDVMTFSTAEEMLAEYQKTIPSIILLDIKLPGISGIEALEKIHKTSPDQPIIMITAFGDVETAIKSMKLGARDYITKPFVIDELRLIVDRIVEESEVKDELRRHQASLKSQYSFGSMIGSSTAMKKVFDLSRKIVEIPNARVLILGESGTGKGKLARAIHYESPQAQSRFVEVSCVNIPETLLESELFGFEAGAFTDAKRTKHGLIEEADGGTLFLDEIGDMGFSLQSKLLKVIEEKSFTRLGGIKPIFVETRIITATNKNLEQLVKEGKFRNDLYYRLNVVTIELPPLREREDDVVYLSRSFMERISNELKRDFKSLSPEVINAFMAYPWPGNIRELLNVIERIIILEKGPVIKLSHLPPEIQIYAEKDEKESAKLETLDEMERKHLTEALKVTGYNVSRAAELLGINRTTILRKLEKWGMDIKDLRSQLDDSDMEEE
jgi:two-component system response regulator AtoC